MPNAPEVERPVLEARQPLGRAKSDEEYWKPVLTNRANAFPSSEQVKRCPACGKDFISEAKYCHACGTARIPAYKETDYWNPSGSMQNVLKMLASVLFAAGLIFALVAAVLGWIYIPADSNGWQVLQNWRIEWLLASAIALLASLCLRIETAAKAETNPRQTP